jgi:hypothetical protein
MSSRYIYLSAVAADLLKTCLAKWVMTIYKCYKNKPIIRLRQKLLYYSLCTTIILPVAFFSYSLSPQLKGREENILYCPPIPIYVI